MLKLLVSDYIQVFEDHSVGETLRLPTPEMIDASIVCKLSVLQFARVLSSLSEIPQTNTSWHLGLGLGATQDSLSSPRTSLSSSIEILVQVIEQDRVVRALDLKLMQAILRTLASCRYGIAALVIGRRRGRALPIALIAHGRPIVIDCFLQVPYLLDDSGSSLIRQLLIHGVRVTLERVLTLVFVQPQDVLPLEWKNERARIFHPRGQLQMLEKVPVPLLGQAPNLEVNDTDNSDGHVEGGKRRNERDVLIGVEEFDAALGRLVSHGLLAIEEEYERRPQHGRHDPAEGDGDAHLATRAASPVDNRSSQREVAVERDEQQIGHARIAERVVEREPEVADEWTRQPLVRDEVNGGDWNRDDADHQVGTGQAYQEVVGYGAQFLVALEGLEDEHVAQRGHNTHAT